MSLLLFFVMLLLETIRLHLLAKSFLASIFSLHICDKITISQSLLSKKKVITLSRFGLFLIISLNNIFNNANRDSLLSLALLLEIEMFWSTMTLATCSFIDKMSSA